MTLNSSIIMPSLPEIASLATPTSRTQAAAAIKPWLEEVRAALKAQFLADNNARQALVQYAQAMDALIARLYAVAVLDAGADAAQLSIMAVGGYGRGLLFPYSDVDLLFLHPSDATPGSMVEAVLYVLWDVGLQVGQSTHTPQSAIALAKADLTVRTNMLDARLIVGDRGEQALFAAKFASEVVEESALEFVDAKLAERAARHKRFGDSRYLLEPNVKEGKGGLRDLHTLHWLVRYVYGVDGIAGLAGKEWLTQEEVAHCEQAEELLSKVRMHLHCAAGRADERLSFDRQTEIAAKLGFDNANPIAAVSAFMKSYFATTTQVGSLTRIVCALLEEDNKRKPKTPLAWQLYYPWKLDGFTLERGRLMVRDDLEFSNDPKRMLSLFRIAQAQGLDIHPKALQHIWRQLDRINEDLRADAQANAVFMAILTAESSIEVTLRRMNEVGMLGRFIPEFGHAVGQTQFNMYHIYTVDEHTLVALGILQAIERGERAEMPAIATELFRHGIASRRTLYLALFCHDIGKGIGGDHSAIGEEMARRLAARFAFPLAEVDDVAWLVREHLLFSHTAFKRDCSDEDTVRQFSARVQTPERLRMLFVMTLADIRATGPQVWNSWKGKLLEDLYAKAEAFLSGKPMPSLARDKERLRDELVESMSSFAERQVDMYLSVVPPALLSFAPAEQHRRILRMLETLHSLPVAIETRVDAETQVTEVWVATSDRKGLFATLAGAFALSGANIVSARIFTLANGYAVDMFALQTALGKPFEEPSSLTRMQTRIKKALLGEVNIASAFAEYTPKQAPRAHPLETAAQVMVDNHASGAHTVIEISARDRRGLLYDITRTLADLGLTITAAYTATYGSRASDVFYVKDAFGFKIEHAGKVEALKAALLAALGQVHMLPEG